MGLEKQLQELHAAGKRIEITWLWDGGIEVNAGGEAKLFRTVAEVSPWLQHWFGIKDGQADTLETERQRIYDSEINITIRTGGKKIFAARGNDFTGFEPKANLSNMAAVLPWLHARFIATC
jgi:hypothetical protein